MPGWIHGFAINKAGIARLLERAWIETGAAMTGKPLSTATADVSVFAPQPVAKRRRVRALWSVMKRKPLGVASALLILLLVCTAIFADVLAPYDPLLARPEIRLLQPSWQHPFGTDDIGRDVFSRIIYGARLSLWVGLLAVGIGTFSGTLIGLICGYWEGRLDLVLQRFMDALQTIRSEERRVG